jgi:anti-repressor protein
MGSDLEIFKYEWHGIRAIIRDGVPWFVAKDVCDILDIGNVSMAMGRLSWDGVSTAEVIDSLGREQQTNIINESNPYKLIFQSRKPEAARFTEWVTGTVLPSIRKYGIYASSIPGSYEDALELAAKEMRQRKALQVENQQLALAVSEAQPKVDFYDEVASSRDSISMRDAAQLLCVPGVGQNNMFRVLRENHILMDVPRNQPYQRYIEAGYFRVIEQHFTDENGNTHIRTKTLVTQRGLDYIRRRLSNEQQA